MTYIIGLCGPSGSGKTTLAKAISQHYGMTHLRQDDYFIDEKHMPRIILSEGPVANWESPESIDFPRLRLDLTTLRAGLPTQVPTYDKRTGTRSGYTTIEPTELMIVEGFLLYIDEPLTACFDLRLYLDAPAQTLRTRRFNRHRDLNPECYDNAVAGYGKLYRQLQSGAVHETLDSSTNPQFLLSKFDEVLRAYAR